MKKKAPRVSSEDSVNGKTLRTVDINKIGQQKRKRSTKAQIIEIVLIVLALILILTGVFLILQHRINELKRQNRVDDILIGIKQGEDLIRVDPADFVVEGEGYEDFEDLRDIDASLFDNLDEVELIAAGVIEIEVIDLALPLWTTADLISLRYGVGIYEGSVDPGEEGNMVVLGHRMRTKGSIFNRLDEVALGDNIIITLMDGTYFTYKVTSIIPRLEPSDLLTVIGQNDVEGKQITLVTCTPVGNSTHRLIVIGHIVE